MSQELPNGLPRCEAYVEVNRPDGFTVARTCELPAGHEGAHRVTVSWSDE